MCICIYMHACLCMCICIYMHECMCMDMYVCVYVPCLDAMAMAATLGMGVEITIAQGQANTSRINPKDR